MKQPSFDFIAPLYRWLEYATLGRALERTRNHHLPALAPAREALLLGDGDGRFTAGLLARHRHLSVHAVDLSARMLALLTARVAPNDRPRLQPTQADALTLPPGPYDLIVTHFFLDCLTQQQTEALVARHAPAATLWLTSEFHAPPGLFHWPARAFIRTLYLAFRILTGLRVTRIPDYATPLRRAGFHPESQPFLHGLLLTTLWRRIPPAKPPASKEAPPSSIL